MINRKLIVVLSMHRSGSSALTRGLRTLGVELGDNLMRPVKANNEKGFFEDLDINRFNEALLEKAGSDWHKLARLDANAFEGPAFSSERREAAKLLTEKLSGDAVFAFKDPRTAVLMPFWRCLFDDLELDHRYILTVRDPLATAASLEARDGFPIQKGVYLWAKHFIEAVERTSDRPRIFVAFDRLLTDPLWQLTRVADALDLPSPDPNSEEFHEYAEEFLEQRLRHNVIGKGELERSGLALDFLVELAGMARDWAELEAGEVVSPDPETWDRIVSRFGELAPLMDLADAVDAQRAVAESKKKEFASKIDDAAARAAAAQEAAGKATEKAAALENERAKLAKTLESERARLNAELEEAARQRNEANASLEALRQSNAEEVGLLQEAKQSLEKEIAAASEQCELLEGRLRAAETKAHEQAQERARETSRADAETRARELAEAAADRARAALADEKKRAAVAAARAGKVQSDLTGRISELEGSAAEAAARLDASASHAQRVEQRLRAMEIERKALRKEQLLTKAALRDMRRSTAWRLTAPLRGAAAFVRNPFGATKRAASAGARGLWRSIPLSASGRGKFAGVLFTVAPFAFFWTPPYKAWRADRRRRSTTRRTRPARADDTPHDAAPGPSAARDQLPGGCVHGRQYCGGGADPFRLRRQTAAHSEGAQ